MLGRATKKKSVIPYSLPFLSQAPLLMHQQELKAKQLA
jgi:hypothetical protein